MTSTNDSECQALIRHHSKSFALAARLLPGRSYAEAATVYAWCRRADDAIDCGAGTGTEPLASTLARLRHELDAVYAGAAPADPVLEAFAVVVQRRGVPIEYPSELLAGMEMDVTGERYRTLDELFRYCYRVASTVGLMMCHVMGVSHPRAQRHAVHLGIAMQLTNVCRDVAEDWQRGRLYLPEELLSRHGVGWLTAHAGGPFPGAAIDGCRAVVAELLAIADRYYASGDAGLELLPGRCAFAVSAARRIYSAIGARLARQGHDVSAPRAVVPSHEKLLHCLRAAGVLLRRAWPFAPRFRAAPLPTLSYVPELVRV